MSFPSLIQPHKQQRARVCENHTCPSARVTEGWQATNESRCGCLTNSLMNYSWPSLNLSVDSIWASTPERLCKISESNLKGVRVLQTWEWWGKLVLTSGRCCSVHTFGALEFSHSAAFAFSGVQICGFYLSFLDSRSQQSLQPLLTCWFHQSQQCPAATCCFSWAVSSSWVKDASVTLFICAALGSTEGFQTDMVQTDSPRSHQCEQQQSVSVR